MNVEERLVYIIDGRMNRCAPCNPLLITYHVERGVEEQKRD